MCDIYSLPHAFYPTYRAYLRCCSDVTAAAGMPSAAATEPTAAVLRSGHQFRVKFERAVTSQGEWEYAAWCNLFELPNSLYFACSALVIHHEEALYQVYAPLPLPFTFCYFHDMFAHRRVGNMRRAGGRAGGDIGIDKSAL